MTEPQTIENSIARRDVTGRIMVGMSNLVAHKWDMFLKKNFNKLNVRLLNVFYFVCQRVVISIAYNKHLSRLYTIVDVNAVPGLNVLILYGLI